MTESENMTRRPLSAHVFHPRFEMAEDFGKEAYSGISPDALKTAYGYDSSADGTGISIAVISALDNAALKENTAVFCKEFGLPSADISIFYPYGRAENTSREWIMESSLDIQWAHAFAPGAKLFAVFSKDAEVNSLLGAAEYAKKELSSDIICMCFGTYESASDKKLSRFMKDGGIFVSPSGDRGGVLSFPSTCPHCISVGGTNLSVSSAGKRYGETAWKNGGGGGSEIFGIPFYQSRFSGLNKMSGGKRGTPDVSMMANYSPGAPVYTAQLGGWRVVGGTSLSCACFSGICACIRQKHPEIMTSSQMLSFLYDKAGGDGYAFPQYNFHDITIGKSGENYAERGWDFATGLGSPVINKILQ